MLWHKFCSLFSVFRLISLVVYFSLMVPVFSYGKVEPSALSSAVNERASKVPEFAFLKTLAKEMGLKVYLFGGTASAFAHYVRWDLEREAGDKKYQEERFDYDYTNIYRGNQDLDIVIDGSVEQANKFRRELERKFPHFVGDRESWEVRTLRTSIGDKTALLKNKEFRNQHTDSNSVGLIDLTTENGDFVFRDLLDWENSSSKYLNDVAGGEIRFYYNSKHTSTKRYKEGNNPPLLAAIRYLAKLTQYEIKGSEEDFKIVSSIIKKTNFKNLSAYAKNKAKEFGLKTLLNSPDVEYAWNVLEKSGLRKKLIEMDGKRSSQYESLSWWMSKEPLRTQAFGKGSGKTAKEIFKEEEIIVSHETNSFVAYENITRSSRGSVNAFVSRQKKTGEMAAYGWGFYTKYGLEGAVGTNLTIRFRLHPEAREGSDFIKAGNFIVVRNKAALILIQEDLNISYLDYYKLRALGEIKPSDKGLVEKLNRKFNRSVLTKEDYRGVINFLIDLSLDMRTISAFSLWLNETEAVNYPEVFDAFEEKITNVNMGLRALPVLEVWYADTKKAVRNKRVNKILFNKILELEIDSTHSKVFEFWFKLPVLRKDPEILKAMALKLQKTKFSKKTRKVFGIWFKMNGVEKFPEVVESLLDQEGALTFVYTNVLENDWAIRKEWVKKLSERITEGHGSEGYREVMRKYIEKYGPDEHIYNVFFKKNNLEINDKIIEAFVSLEYDRYRFEFFEEKVSKFENVKDYNREGVFNEMLHVLALTKVFSRPDLKESEQRFLNKVFNKAFDSLTKSLKGRDNHGASIRRELITIAKILATEMRKNKSQLDEEALFKHIENFKSETRSDAISGLPYALIPFTMLGAAFGVHYLEGLINSDSVLLEALFFTVKGTVGVSGGVGSFISVALTGSSVAEVGSKALFLNTVRKQLNQNRDSRLRRAFLNPPSCRSLLY